MSKSSLTIEDAFAAAFLAGLTVRVPEAFELFLDIDNQADYVHFVNTIGNLPGVKTWVKGPSKSGYPKAHVVVTLDHDVTNDERILLQACLGSDRKHELLCFLASKSGNPCPSVLFERR